MSAQALTRRLSEHVQVPLYREGYALILSTAISSVFGFAYWIVAARTYSAHDVGLNSAAIAAMMLVAAIAQLNLLGALVRFVPGAGRTTWRLIGWAYAASLTASVVVGVVFLAGTRVWAPQLAFLSSDDGWAVWFVGATMVWSVFSLQDGVLTGLRRAIWVPVDNTLFGAIKIVLLVALAGTLRRFGIFVSWTLGAAICVAAISVVLIRLVGVHVTEPPPADAAPVTPRLIRRFVTADLVGGLSWTVAITLIPIVITQRLGAADTAYYYMAWVMVVPLYLVSASTANTLVVSLVRDGVAVREYASRVAVQTARIVVPGAFALALAAPLFLSVFGDAYRREGTTTLRLLALSAIPNMVCTLYVGVWRAERRLSLLAWVRVVQNLAVIALGVALLEPYGIAGPAVAWIVVQTAVAAALVVRYPHTLTDGIAHVRWALRTLLLARNAAERTGTLRLARATRSTQDGDRVADAVPAVLAALPDGWVAQRPLRSVTDHVVVLVGPPGGSCAAAIKLAGPGRACRSLEREIEALRSMAADRRLEPLRGRLPQLLAEGDVDGTRFAVQHALPGVIAAGLGRRLLEDGRLTSLAEPITALHRLTAEPIEVGADVLRAWIEEPVAVVAAHRTSAWQARALGRLADELVDAFAGRTLTAGRTHGDYVPGNILLDPETGEVTGILDWELSRSLALPALDRVQLELAARAVARRHEPGEVVSRALRDGSPPRELVLLAWLHHVAGVLTKADRYAGHRLWTKANVDTVLVRLA